MWGEIVAASKQSQLVITTHSPDLLDFCQAEQLRLVENIDGITHSRRKVEMARNKIYAIVEGHGEAEAPRKGEQAAVTVLIAKLLADLQCWTLFPAKKPPWRMRSSGDFFAAGKLENVICAHKMFPDCAALLVLLDMDDDCLRFSNN